MLLSARILTNVFNVNAFDYTPYAEFTEGDGPTIYLQLVDITQDRPDGRRFMPAPGATLECVIHNIDDAKQVKRFASQPYPQDPSIWALVLLPTDKVRGTCDLLLALTEGGKTTRGAARSAISVQSLVRGF